MDRTQDMVSGDATPQSSGNDNAASNERLPPRSPRGRALDLCREIIWWHTALGSPVTLELVMGERREHWISAVRGDCVRRVREVTKWSYPRIGRFFGLDHSTCIHHVQARGVGVVRSLLKREGARRIAQAWRSERIAESPDRWAIIPSHPKYSVADNGLVRFDETGGIRTPRLAENGYLYLTFQTGFGGSKARFRSVHGLVMEAFVGPLRAGLQVCHVDGNRLNNSLKNLRYGTAKENAADRDWHGMTRRGVENGNAKIRHQEVIDEIRSAYADGEVSQYDLARRYGISQAQINNIVLNKQHRREAVGQPTYEGANPHENP